MSLRFAASRLALLAGALCASVSARAQEAPEEEVAAPAEEAAPPAEEEAAPAADEEAAPAPEGGGNPEAMVTAAKREQPLRQVPLAVSVVDGATIARTAVRDLADLAALVPSLRVTRLGNRAQTQFTLRGFGNGAGNPGIEPGVGVFVDGVYRSRSDARIADLADVERVEVLRGPHSVLYGKNASAGAISVITREPQFAFGGALEAAYGAFDGVVLRGLVTGPVAAGVAASLSAGYNRRDGYITDSGWGGTANNRNRWFVRGQLRIAPTEQFNLRLIADFDRIDEVCCAAVTLRRSAATAALEAQGGRVSDVLTPFADTAYSNFAPTGRIDNKGVSAQADYTLGPLKFTSITAWRHSRTRTAQDPDFTSADLFAASTAETEIDTLTQEVRIQAGILDVINATVGGLVFDENVQQQAGLAYGARLRPYVDLLSGGGITALEAAVPLAAGTLLRGGQGSTESYRLNNRAWTFFGAIDFKFADRFTLGISGNHTRDRKTGSLNVVSTDWFSALNLASYGAASLAPYQFLPPVAGLPGTGEDGKFTDGDWSWNFRLGTELTPQVRGYLSYAFGYKPASFDMARTSRPGSRFARPEDIRAFEAGLKADFGPAAFNLALFHQRVDGFQTLVAAGPNVVFGNAGRQSAYGVEVEGQVRPAPALALNLALTWLAAKYDSFTNSPVGDLSGRRPAGIPALSTTLGAEWSKPLGADRLIARADFHYESPVQLLDGAALPFRREVSELGASLTWAMASGIEATLWARNLLDNRTIEAIFAPLGQPGALASYPNQPRTWGASLRFKW